MDLATKPVSVTLVASVAAIVLYLCYKLLNVGRRPPGYPPGPPTLPILGNLHQMPAKDPHLQFKKWAEEYGPIYSLVLGTRTYIILSSEAAVRDLLDKRSNIYSSRPDLYIGATIASGGMRVSLMPYGQAWRLLRKLVHRTLNIRAAQTYTPYQDLETKELLFGLLSQPGGFVDHIRRHTYSFTSMMVYGFRVVDLGDPKFQQLYHGFEKWVALVTSKPAQMLDLFPILRRLPSFLLPVYRYAVDLHQAEKALYLGHWFDTKKVIAQGSGKPCFCVDLLRTQKTENLSDDQASYVAGILLEAGSDTTANTLTGFVQAMTAFPEAQKKAQEEIDRVVGPERLPTMEDAENLPYIRACVKEALRWMPTVILGLPHCVTRDDEYMGYRIPAGATVDINVWALNMDPTRYSSPQSFTPDRHLNTSEPSLAPSPAAATIDNDPENVARSLTLDHFSFGAGRRICQGMHVASRSMFLAIARMLWAFDILPDPSEAPVKIHEFTQALVVQPLPFRADFRPRSEESAEVVRRCWRECQERDLVGEGSEKGQWRRVPEGMRWGAVGREDGVK